MTSGALGGIGKISQVGRSIGPALLADTSRPGQQSGIRTAVEEWPVEHILMRKECLIKCFDHILFHYTDHD